MLQSLYSPGKQSMLSIERKAMWAPEPVHTYWRRGKQLGLARNQIPDHSIHSLVTIPPELYQQKYRVNVFFVCFLLGSQQETVKSHSYVYWVYCLQCKALDNGQEAILQDILKLLISFEYSLNLCCNFTGSFFLHKNLPGFLQLPCHYYFLRFTVYVQCRLFCR